MATFQPDYRRIVAAARNQNTAWIPLYDHIVCEEVISAVMGQDICGKQFASHSEVQEYFRVFCQFFQKMGYDSVSFECCASSIMPGSGALGGHIPGVIQCREDFEAYPWDTICDRYFTTFDPSFKALRDNLPEGMKAVGGVGNGVFECVQDLVGYENLCYIRADDPELYEDLFRKVGDVLLAIWKRFLETYGDSYCVCRFGDDLGYKSSTLLIPDDIRQLVVPVYRKIIDQIHAAGKPFLLHSCGCIFNVMDDLIREGGIDAKHSNEDVIAPFPVWVERYGDRIGNFGGIDTDAVCRLDETAMKRYIEDVVQKSHGHGGFAFGSGNSIPNYVPVSQYLMMNRILREIRGE